ncbi:MAG: hypothetical protein AABW79_00820 [Nanoarchaeota archaeon]
MPDNSKQIALYRSEVIEKFINIEKIMNLIISQHYCDVLLALKGKAS